MTRPTSIPTLWLQPLLGLALVAVTVSASCGSDVAEAPAAGQTPPAQAAAQESPATQAPEHPPEQRPATTGQPVRPAVPNCSKLLTRTVLEQSLALGTGFLLAHQKPEGNFDYEYDWQLETYDPDDSQVRQAGTLWGLALIRQAARTPNPDVDRALTRGLAFFEKHSVTRPDGARYIRYPGAKKGSTGTIALVALALIEHLRAGGIEAAERTTLEGRLDEYLAFLLAARTEDGRWHNSFSYAEGRSSGDPSPYFDGEALLALVKAARYLGKRDLAPAALEAAEAGYRANVTAALAAEPDSATTKGYYQWASMAYFELATSQLGSADVRATYGDRLLQLADWMIDVHRTLDRQRNTGYAYEGIIHAYEWAARAGAGQRAEKYACVIERGLEKLISWQVGSSLANEFVSRAPPLDERARGGVQNHGQESALRIDVTQHQMHAVILALRYVYPEGS